MLSIVRYDGTGRWVDCVWAMPEEVMEQDEAGLVERSQRGELAAFNSIVERYQTQVYNVVARILWYQATAEDVTQEAFLSAFRAIGRFRGGSLRAWLLRIASNASYDYLRSRRRRPEDSLDQALENPGFALPSGEESPGAARPEKGAGRGDTAGYPVPATRPADDAGADRRPGTQLR